MALPTFSFEATVSQGSAKQDRIQLGIEDGLLFGDADDVGTFLNYLGSPPRDWRNESGLAPYGRLFTGQQGQAGRFDRQRVRATPLRFGSQDYAPPLAAGWLDVRRLPMETWRTELTLFLNPTRFARHQAMPPRIDLFQIEPQLHRFAVSEFAREIQGFYEDEFALAEWDNWIPNSRQWQRFVSETIWPHHLRSCVTMLSEAVLGEFDRVAELIGPQVRLGGSPRFNVRSVETYWEFLSSDPLGTVLALEPMLRTFSARLVSVTDYPCTLALEPHENSRCLRLETRGGETLKIYAKTNRRIRFEVLHQLTGDRGFRVQQGGHTFPEIEGAFPLFTQLAVIAATRVNELLHHFRLNASVPDRPHTVLKFLHDFQSAFDQPERSLELLQILTNNSSLVVGPGIPLRRVFQRELFRLCERGVLLSVNRRYSVAPAYQQALLHLQQRGTGFLLGIRIRRRPPR